MRNVDEHDRLFPDARDRDLIFVDEAAALCGCSVEEFLCGVGAGMFPQWNGYPYVSKQWCVVGVKPDGSPRWEQKPRWRRGEVIRKLEELGRRVAPMFESAKRKDVR